MSSFWYTFSNRRWVPDLETLWLMKRLRLKRVIQTARAGLILTKQFALLHPIVDMAHHRTTKFVVLI